MHYVVKLNSFKLKKGDLGTFTNANILYKECTGTIIFKCEVYQKITLFKFKAVKNGILPSKSGKY